MDFSQRDAVSFCTNMLGHRKECDYHFIHYPKLTYKSSHHLTTLGIPTEDSRSILQPWREQASEEDWMVVALPTNEKKRLCLHLQHEWASQAIWSRGDLCWVLFAHAKASHPA